MPRRYPEDGAAHAVDSPSTDWWRGTVGVLGAALLFNLGQGVLRPTTPLYLQQVFAANYRMVTAIPTVFGAGKWSASLPTAYLLSRLGKGSADRTMTPERLARIREEEQRNAARALGV